jgi:hypothetical protein
MRGIYATVVCNNPFILLLSSLFTPFYRTTARSLLLSFPCLGNAHLQNKYIIKLSY